MLWDDSKSRKENVVKTLQVLSMLNAEAIAACLANGEIEIQHLNIIKRYELAALKYCLRLLLAKPEEDVSLNEDLAKRVRHLLKLETAIEHFTKTRNPNG